MDSHTFPFVIEGENGPQKVPDIAEMVFGFMGQFDTKTLLTLRLVSQGWRECVDTLTPLWSRMSLVRAIQDERTDIAQLIIDNVEDKNPADNYGETPLHRAAEKGHTEICRMIIENVEDKNPANNNGKTPLH